jgi:hypothetical protein
MEIQNNGGSNEVEAPFEKDYFFKDNARVEDTLTYENEHKRQVSPSSKRQHKLRIKNRKRVMNEFTLDWTSLTRDKIPEYHDVLDRHLTNHFSKPIYKKQLKRLHLRNSLRTLSASKANSLQHMSNQNIQIINSNTSHFNKQSIKLIKRPLSKPLMNKNNPKSSAFILRGSKARLREEAPQNLRYKATKEKLPYIQTSKNDKPMHPNEAWIMDNSKEDKYSAQIMESKSSK